MAIVNMNSVQLWTSFSNPFFDKHQKASLHKARSVCKTASSQDQPALPYDKADRISKRKDPFKSSITTPRHQDSFTASVQGYDNILTNYDDDEADDEFPSIEELLSQSSRQGISTKYQNSEDTLQHLEESTLNTSGSRLSPEQSRLDDSAGNRQGTRDEPVILEDDESDAPDPEATAVFVSVDARADPPFEPSTEPWYDVEDECFVDEDLLPVPPLKQGGLASTPTSTPAQDQPHSLHYSPGSSQDQISLHENISEELAAYTLPEFEDRDSEGWSNNVAELEKEVQRSIQGQEEVPSTGAPSSPRPCRPSIEPTHPQIDQEDDQSGTSYRLNGSDCSVNISDEDDEDPRPAKRRKLPPTPTKDALTPPNEPIPTDNNHYYALRTSRSPSITVELAPVAEYQEWPFQGFLKRTKIGDETTYNLEFTLPHILNHVHLPISSESLGNGSNKETPPVEAATFHNAMAHSKVVHPAASQSRSKRVRWTPEEDAKLVRMKEEDGCSWEEIHTALPHRTQGTIQVRYSTKLKRSYGEGMRGSPGNRCDVG